MNKDKFIRTLNYKTYDMDLPTYMELFHTDGRFLMMSDNFFKWYCQLDSDNVKKFLNYCFPEEKR